MTEETEQESKSDEELIAQGESLCLDDFLLPGVRLLRKVNDKELLTSEHLEFLRRAELSEELRAQLTAPIECSGWKKQAERHGDRDFITYYKVEDCGQLSMRIDSVIESSLFHPFLATLNETDLYETWFPKWNFPKLGLHSSIKLAQPNKLSQVVQLTIDLPFPLCKREIVVLGYADDDADENRNAALKLITPHPNGDGASFCEVIPPSEKGVVRMPFEAGFLFQPCPVDHPALLRSKGNYPPNETKILLSCLLMCDPKIPHIPQALLNFGTRTALPSIWAMFLSIAEQVRNGDRPAHAVRIEAKRQEIYNWLEWRASIIGTDVEPTSPYHNENIIDTEPAAHPH